MFNQPYQLSKVELFNDICTKQPNLKNIIWENYLSPKQISEKTELKIQ